MRPDDERLVRLQYYLAIIAAGDGDRRAEIDDHHALGMRQLAPGGEAAGALGIVAIAVDQPGNSASGATSAMRRLLMPSSWARIERRRDSRAGISGW